MKSVNLVCINVFRSYTRFAFGRMSSLRLALCSMRSAIGVEVCRPKGEEA